MAMIIKIIKQLYHQTGKVEKWLNFSVLYVIYNHIFPFHTIYTFMCVEEKIITHNLPLGSFSCNLFSTLISRRAASRYLLIFLITFNANCRPSLVLSLTCTTLPNVPSPNVRTISSKINNVNL